MVFLIDMGSTDLTLAAWQTGRPPLPPAFPPTAQRMPGTTPGRLPGRCKAGARPPLRGARSPAWCRRSPGRWPPPCRPRPAFPRCSWGTRGIWASKSSRGTGSAPTCWPGPLRPKKRGALPAIVADLGTATTFCAQNAAGDVLGVSSRRASPWGWRPLVGRASHLRTVAF